MKKSVITTLLLVALIQLALAQEKQSWEVTSIAFQTGESSLVSGNMFSLTISKDKSAWMFDLNDKLGEAIYLYSPKSWFSIGHSEGVFKRVLWAGPIATLNFPKLGISTMHWPGWSIGDPEIGKTEGKILFCFNYHQFNWTYKSVTASYIYSKYQANTCNYVGLKKVLPINKNLSAFGAGLYCFENEDYLWSMGLTYDFTKSKSGLNGKWKKHKVHKGIEPPNKNKPKNQPIIN